MKAKISVLAGIVLVALAVPPVRAGQVIDRIVAAVNGHIILQSDWDDALRYEAFSNGRAPEQLTFDDRKAALDRLIDQELLREQMHAADFQHATEAEISRRIAEIRKQDTNPDTTPDNEQAWQSALGRYGLTMNELKQRVGLELDLLRLVDSRLRPTVTVDAKSIESYYNQELLPQLRASGAKEPALSEARQQIQELLTQQKMNQLLVAWLQNLRSGSEIRSEADPGGELR